MKLGYLLMFILPSVDLLRLHVILPSLVFCLAVFSHNFFFSLVAFFVYHPLVLILRLAVSTEGSKDEKLCLLREVLNFLREIPAWIGFSLSVPVNKI